MCDKRHVLPSYEEATQDVAGGHCICEITADDARRNADTCAVVSELGELVSG